jgi:hypothetical protein
MIWPDITTAVVACSLLGCASAYLARKRGKNPLFWFATGFLFGLIGVVAILFAPKPKRKTRKATPPRTPEPVLDGPVDKFWYYLDAAHITSPPMSHQAITKEWKSGRLSPKTFIWHEDLSNWTPLEEIVKLKT